DELHKRMDAHAWEVIQPAADPANFPALQFRNSPPPDDARVVEVRGLEGITEMRVTSVGEMFFERPADLVMRAAWYTLGDRILTTPNVFATERSQASLLIIPSAGTLERVTRYADELARRGELEEAAAFFSRIQPHATSIDDQVHGVLRDIGFHDPGAARRALE